METPGAVPRVSQYRLAAHLGTAFVAYSAMLWTGMDIIRQNKPLSDYSFMQKLLPFQREKIMRFFKLSRAATGLIFVTALTGSSSKSCFFSCFISRNPF